MTVTFAKMIRMQKGPMDPEAEMQKINEEAEMARTATVYNIVSFFVVCGIIRSVPYFME